MSLSLLSIEFRCITNVCIVTFPDTSRLVVVLRPILSSQDISVDFSMLLFVNWSILFSSSTEILAEDCAACFRFRLCLCFFFLWLCFLFFFSFWSDDELFSSYWLFSLSFFLEALLFFPSLSKLTNKSSIEKIN